MLTNVVERGQRYRHFKGNIYCVVGVGEHTETQEQFVVYCSENNLEKLWIRPLSMFMENVTKPEYTGPRFVKI